MAESKITVSGDMIVARPIEAWPNAWARISEIAAKVGVNPCEFGNPATITATGADGKAYDVWEVVSRVLDKIAES